MKTLPTREVCNLVLLSVLHDACKDVKRVDKDNPLANYLDLTLAERNQEYEELVKGLRDMDKPALVELMQSAPPASALRFEIFRLLASLKCREGVNNETPAY